MQKGSEHAHFPFGKRTNLGFEPSFAGRANQLARRDDELSKAKKDLAVIDRQVQVYSLFGSELRSVLEITKKP